MSQNLYAYTGSNPVRYTDPTGHRREVCDNGSYPNLEGPYYPDAKPTTVQAVVVVGTLFALPIVAAVAAELVTVEVLEAGAAKIVEVAARVIFDEAGSIKVPNWKSATSAELRRFATKAGLLVEVGSNHLKVFNALGQMITQIRHTVHSGSFAVKDITLKILSSMSNE